MKGLLSQYEVKERMKRSVLICLFIVRFIEALSGMCDLRGELCVAVGHTSSRLPFDRYLFQKRASYLSLN